jgi:hypothetical protein
MRDKNRSRYTRPFKPIEQEYKLYETVSDINCSNYCISIVIDIQRNIPYKLRC